LDAHKGVGLLRMPRELTKSRSTLIYKPSPRLAVGIAFTWQKLVTIRSTDGHWIGTIRIYATLNNVLAYNPMHVCASTKI
jgi:hypothetical protein